MLALAAVAATAASSVHAADPTDRGDLMALGSLRKLTGDNTPCVASCTASPCCGVTNGRLTEVRYQNLGLKGMIPSDISHASNLKVIELSGNQLYGTVPGSIGGLSSLKELRLNNNELTGSVPRPLTNLKGSLSTLLLNSNRMKGDMTVEFAQLALQVNEVNVADNQFKTALPTNYKFGGRNVQIDGSNSLCQIAGNVGGKSNTVPKCNATCDNHSCPSALTKLQNSCVDCNDDQCCERRGTPTHATDKAVYDWLVGGHGGGWSQLGECGTTPCSSSPCCRMTTTTPSRITEIRMKRKYLSGKLPVEIAQLEALVLLDLQSNDLTGTIPAAYGYLPNIYEMYLGENKLSGAVPLSFEFLKSAAAGDGITTVGVTRKNDVCMYSGVTIDNCKDCAGASACTDPKPAAPDPLQAPATSLPTGTGNGGSSGGGGDTGGGGTGNGGSGDDFGGGGGGGNGGAAGANVVAVVGIVAASVLAMVF